MKKVKIIQKIDRPRAKFIKVCDGKSNFDLFVRSDFHKLREGRCYEVEYDMKNTLKSYKQTEFAEYDKLVESEINYKKEFVMEHADLNALQDRYDNFCHTVLKAVVEGRVIYIRHDNDCDGMSSGIMLELALKKVKSNYDKSNTQIINRSAMMKPYYPQDDALFDALRASMGYKPLLIILDHGSDNQNIAGLSILKSLRFDLAVIDHHDFAQDLTVDKMINAHINPYLVDGDSSLCTGVLTYELIKKLGVDFLDHVPAIPAYSDRSPEEVTSFYFERSKEKLKLEKVEDLLIYTDACNTFCSTFRSANMGDFLVNFYRNPAYYVDMCKVLAQNREVLLDDYKKKIGEYIKVEELSKSKLIHIKPFDIINSKYELRIRDMAGIITDNFCDENTMLVLQTRTGLTMRVGDKVDFSITEFLDELIQTYPKGFFGGGGHPQAGTLDIPEVLMPEAIALLKSKL